MTTTIKELKQSIRTTMLQKRADCSPSYCQIYSDAICEKLWNLIEVRQAKVIHSYLPMDKEINIRPLLEKALLKGLKVVSPKTLKKRQLQHLILHNLEDVEKGIWGTTHPANSTRYSGAYDLIIVPGLAFSNQGCRLGYGAGYYDSFLAKHPLAFKVGICYPFQLLEEIPIEDHDVKLDKIIC